MKKIIIFTMLFVLSATSISQKAFISIGPELAFPGSFGLSRNAGSGFGGSIRVETYWSKHISGIATIGYLSFAQQELTYSGTPPTTAKFKAIPIQAGLKYYPMERKKTPKGFFISTELGFMPTTIHFDYVANPDLDFKESGLSCATGIGYQLRNIESGFRLQFNLTASGFDIYYYNFRIAYAFLKKKGKE